jgi:hypothetical protein
MKRCLLGFLLAICMSTPALAADGLIAKRIVYVGNASTARAKAFEEFLRANFAEVMITERKGFDVALAKGADVVLLDWSQQDNRSTDAQSPLGPRESWSTPTVLLGSAGHLLAGCWEIIGGSG